MRITTLAALLLAAGLTAALLPGCATRKADSAALEAGAKIAKADAERIALARVPGGTIKEGDIEKEKGKVIWSFDITTPGSPDITEVAVDAMTGDVVAVDKETPAQQAEEKKADAKEKKGKKEKDDDKDEKK